MKEKLMNNKYLVGICVVVCLFFGYQWMMNQNDESTAIEFDTENVEEVEMDIEPESETVIEEVQSIMVDVKGAVNTQGVYELRQGDRVKDAIDMAGGVTENADELQVNYAQILEDEMLLYVPAKGEVGEIATTTEINGTETNNGLVNINKATSEELQNLTGVGPSKAEAIIAYREENGGFQTIEDLQNVTGIGEKSFEKLKGEISVK